MSDIFCYFLGAGASRNALPIVKEIPQQMEAFIKRLGKWSAKTGNDSSALAEAASWLLEQTLRHASIDTFAKKLFLRNARDDLKRLKAVTSCFFVYEQSQKPVDFRYDTFLASIINTEPGRPATLPNNIRILSWNYDTQLEKAFFSISENQEHVMKEITFSDQIERLNGYCGTHPPGHLGAAYLAAIGDSSQEGLTSAVNLYNAYMKEFNSVPPDINFAWEADPEVLLRDIRKVISDVTVVILIGYSFPFFNRQIDRLILNNMNSLRKFYVQLPETEHRGIVERLKALRPDLPEPMLLGDTSSFYIPFDYP